LQPFVPVAVCTNSARPEIRVLQVEQAAKLCGDSRTLVADVRSGPAFAEGHVAQAVHIPCSGSMADVAQVRERLKDKHMLVVYGETEEQAHKVANDLGARIGRPDLALAVLAGGWRAWFEAGLACASGPCDECEEMLSHEHP
jgi:rhodanese-related sulfurtransferase